MTTREIQRAVRTIHCEGLEQSAAIRDILQRKSRFDAAAKSWKLKHLEPGPGRATKAFAKFTFEEQERIEGYAQHLINEAHALCLRLQGRCPILREGGIDGDALFSFES